MFNFTPEERKVTVFFLTLALCGLILNNLVKINCTFKQMIYPAPQLAKLNLNQASLKELATVKCLPKKLLQRIIEYRAQRQAFSSLEELKEIKGIGPERYDKLKEVFFVE